MCISLYFYLYVAFEVTGMLVKKPLEFCMTVISIHYSAEPLQMLKLFPELSLDREQVPFTSLVWLVELHKTDY